jgi:hypothetical protein
VVWVSLIIGIAAFLIGGSSEPVTACMFAVFSLLLFYVWRQIGPQRRTALTLLGASLLGTILALCALFFAPGNLLHGKTSLSILPVAVMESFWFAFKFVRGTILTLPLPTLLSVLIPGLLFFCLYINPENQPFHPEQKRRIKTLLILVPVLHFLLIVASFAPSAYGQDFPAERARFLGRFLMTASLIFEGALLGTWFAQLQEFSPRRHLIFPLTGFLLLVVGFYPLRGVYSMLGDVESYKSSASAWDKREADIYSLIATGEQDLVVRWLHNRYGVKDIDGSIEHWVNKCAAKYYGVSTIRSIPMDR